METQIDLNKINDRIRSLKETAEELSRMAGAFPALEKNTARILASIKMLELNASDAVDL
jgi:hypothetical protein